MGALAFAYATYNPVIISAGHNTKLWSMCYMPALLGSFLLLYRKHYWLGGALVALFTSIIIAMNHLQITYYIFLILGIATIFHIIYWIRQKQWKQLTLSIVFALISTLIGLLTNAVTLFSTYDYQKETIRGGSGSLADPSNVGKSKTGLDKDYAFGYSLQISEPFVMMVPKMFGGSSDKEEVSQDNSMATAAMSSLPQQLQQQLPLTYYWGGLIDTGVGTSGPPYVGAIICFLAIIAMFILKGREKWWMFAAIVLSIMMSWGSFFEGFNALIYNYLPFYNKFRAPSMILVIPQLLLPLLAILCVEKIARAENTISLLPEIKKGIITSAVIIIILFLLYFSFDFLSKGDKSILSRVNQSNQPEIIESIKSFFKGLVSDRKSLMMDSILRSLLFMSLSGVCLYLMLKKTLNTISGIMILTGLSFIDVITIDTKYLSAENFKDVEETTANFIKNKADEEILRDTTSFRVFNMSGNAFSENITSYYYNSIGGYHPAKLRIYQDLIEKQLSKEQPNMAVFNMLNTKYFIQKDGQGITQKYQKNESALGNCWFVKAIHYVKDANAEMAALDHFNPRDTAIVLESYRRDITTLEPDNNATIRLVKNDNDLIQYVYTSSGRQFAVFSEIYYNAGWKAFVDQKEASIIKVNYVLRGLAVPAGRHQIEFKFLPPAYLMGSKLTSIFSIILILFLASAIFLSYRSHRGSQNSKV
ncbi:MAG: YfhO family protein [Flavisolibacter sp.]